MFYSIGLFIDLEKSCAILFNLFSSFDFVYSIGNAVLDQINLVFYF